MEFLGAEQSSLINLLKGPEVGDRVRCCCLELVSVYGKRSHQITVKECYQLRLKEYIKAYTHCGLYPTPGDLGVSRITGKLS